MFSAFRRNKAHPSSPVGTGGSPSKGSESDAHNGSDVQKPLKMLKESFKHMTNEFHQEPMQMLICHIIECIHIMSTITVPSSGTGRHSTKSISNVTTVCNSTFYDVMEIILAEVFCVQPSYSLSNPEAKFCNAVGCCIARLYPSFLSRPLNDRTKKALLHIVSQQPVYGLETVTFVHQICPDQAKTQDASGALPLHYAAHSLHHSQPLIVEYLLKAYPEGASVTDKEGYLPLHWAVNSGALRMDSVRHLLTAYPEGARVPCVGGTLPLHWAVDRDDMNLEVVKVLSHANPQAHQSPSTGDWLPLHRCVDREKIDLEVLQFLIQQYPKGLMAGNIDGHLPIHRIVDREQIDCAALELLIRACPESLLVPDLEGYLPLHTLLEAYSIEADLQAFHLVLSGYPDAASLATSDGLCPLHCAMGLGQEWNIALLKALVIAYPNGCVEEAVDTEPEDPTADPVTYTGRWKKFKWTPLSRATEVGDKPAIELLKKAINKMALQKMTQKKLSSASPPKAMKLEHSESEGQAVKLKSGQIAAIANKQPKQRPVVLPRPHMQGGHRVSSAGIGSDEATIANTAHHLHSNTGNASSTSKPAAMVRADAEDDTSIVMDVAEDEFGLSDIHGTSRKNSPNGKPKTAKEGALDVDMPNALHVEDSDWLDGESVLANPKGITRTDVVARDQGNPRGLASAVAQVSGNSSESINIVVVGEDTDSDGGDTQYTMRDRRHVRQKDIKTIDRKKKASTPGGMPEDELNEERGGSRSPIDRQRQGRGSEPDKPTLGVETAGPLNLKEREATRLRELERQKQERATRQAEKQAAKHDKKHRKDNDRKNRADHGKGGSGKGGSSGKYNTAAAGDILGGSGSGGVHTNFNYEMGDTPVPSSGMDRELRMTGSDSSGDLRPQALFPQGSPTNPQPASQPVTFSVRRGNSNLGTIAEKEVEIDSPMKMQTDRPPLVQSLSSYHVGEPVEPSSFDEDDENPPPTRNRPLNLAEREKERLQELEKQKINRDKQLVVKQTLSKSGKEKLVVKPSQPWGGKDRVDVESVSSGHYNTSSAKQILQKASSKEGAGSSKDDNSSNLNVLEAVDSPSALFEQSTKRVPVDAPMDGSPSARPNSANAARKTAGGQLNRLSYENNNGNSPHRMISRPASAHPTGGGALNYRGSSGRRPPDEDDKISISSRASRKVALEHMHNNFG